MKKPLFKGSGVALITPMHPDGSVNYEKLKELVEWHIENGTDAIIACGTTGESSTLTDLEHKKVIEEVVNQAKKRVPVIAGTGSNSTSYAIELSKEAESLKADGVLVVSPYYNKASQTGLIKHYKCIADSINIPVIVYDVPSRTGCKIEISTLKELSKHENITAIKAASGSISDVAKIANACEDNLFIFSGNDDQTVPIMSLGGVGVISVLANIAPAQTHKICELYLNGNCKESASLQLEFLNLINALFIEVNPIPVKEAMNLMGMQVGSCRLPLCELDEQKLKKLKLCLEKHKFI